ncbi:MAG: hypothetical protein ACTHK2_09255 [Dokdonella sp.]|uniref:hypothetical protein n=1 Tax=Dokdonella sp. TaxID=2291710 RepID=UPI003F8132AF
MLPTLWIRLLAGACALVAPAAHARATEPPVRATVTLVHASDAAWRVEYRLSEPVDTIELGPPIVEYRASAWTLGTPGLSLTSDATGESIRSDTPFARAVVEIRDYAPWAHDQYIPIDRHSDGGHAFYLGHLMGSVRQGKRERNMLVTFELVGLHGENVLLAEQANDDQGTYAYFGPHQPVDTGAVRLIVDPKTPRWSHDAIDRVVAPLASYYQHAFARAWRAPPLVIIGAGRLDEAGFSIKGGALPGELFFRIAGRDALVEAPTLRMNFEQLVAHELAHVWQDLVRRGGTGERTEAWIHEGGAQALSLAALEGAGVWDSEEAVAFKRKLHDECAARREAPPRRHADASREAYTCGYERFAAYPLGAIELWKDLIAETERSGAPYSAAMVERINARKGWRAP